MRTVCRQEGNSPKAKSWSGTISLLGKMVQMAVITGIGLRTRSHSGWINVSIILKWALGTVRGCGLDRPMARSCEHGVPQKAGVTLPGEQLLVSEEHCCTKCQLTVARCGGRRSGPIATDGPLSLSVSPTRGNRVFCSSVLTATRVNGQLQDEGAIYPGNEYPALGWYGYGRGEVCSICVQAWPNKRLV